MTEISRNFDGKKFMWDGEFYASEELVKETETKYKGNGFETRSLNEDGKYILYTRRLVSEIVLEGAVP